MQAGLHEVAVRWEYGKWVTDLSVLVNLFCNISFVPENYLGTLVFPIA